MIRANHYVAAQVLFYAYIRRLMKGHFSNFYLTNAPPEISDEDSLVITPNHISWWDGFFIAHVERRFYSRRVHIMMLEEQLRKYWFFSKIGAYSVSPGNPKSLMETRAYTREIISSPSNSVVIYPQGEIEDYAKRPLSLKKGWVRFLGHPPNDILVVPVAFKIQFYNEMKPSIVVRFGRPIRSVEIERSFNVFEDEFYDNLEQLSNAIGARTFAADLFKREPRQRK